MVKKKTGRGGGSGGKAPKAGGPKKSGIEKYGEDDADKMLGLYDDEHAAENEVSDGDFEEQDVMAFEDEFAEEEKPKKKKDKKKKRGAKEEDEDDAEAEEEEAPAGRGQTPGSVGWRGKDFYGGDDAGDESEAASEEEMVMEEAKKLEELRSARLRGHEDILGALIDPPAADADEAAEGGKKGKAKSSGSGATALTSAAAGAQFESVFAAEAEHSSVVRDLSQLSESKKKGLIRREMPELMPLLEDFKAKVSGLQELLPLLAPAAVKRLPKSGAAFLEAKASLLLNTLANLSFYLLLRAEGGSVRSHPVVSQLVWLRELQEKVAPLDEQLGKKMRKALKAARNLIASGDGEDADDDKVAAAASSRGPDDAAVHRQPKKQRSLRDRLEKLRATLPAVAASKSAVAPPRPALRKGAATSDLLRLPSRRKTPRGGDAEAGADLEEADPTLGFRRVGAPIGEAMSSMQQLLRERAVKDKVGSADQNVEARKRPTREKFDEKPKDDLEPMEKPEPRKQKPAADEDDPADDELVRTAKAASRAKKEKKTQAQEQKEAHRLLRQYHPENEVDGRRKTHKRILENRGLVRVRKNKAGNARVTNRGKYEKMLKRRKGAVQEMREGASDGAGYDGEATGVRTRVKKSLKLS